MTAGARPDKIALARESRGLTQAELAERAGISQGQVSKIEMGMLSVSASLLERICAVLGYPPSLFFMDDMVIGGGPSDLYHHRKRQSATLKLMRKIYAQINLRRIQIARLLQSVNFTCNVPKYPAEEFDEIEVARMVRAFWHLPQGPIANLTDLVERAGAIIVPCNFETPLVDGISQWLPGQPPMFFINAAMARSRYRMTLAHELGHMLLHAVPNPNMEAEATHFAGEFLLPAQDVRNDLRHLQGLRVADCLSRIAELKPIWRVSMQAIVVRASELNVLPQPTITSLWRRMSQLGYKRNEPLEHELPFERPNTLRELVAVHLKRLKFTVTQLAEAVGLLVEEFRRLYLPQEAGHLRAV